MMRSLLCLFGPLIPCRTAVKALATLKLVQRVSHLDGTLAA